MIPENTGARYQLRPAASADFEFIRHLNRELFRTFVEQIWGWDEAVQNDLLRKGFRPDLTQIISCERVDIGFFVVERLTNEIFLRSIVIATSHQRLGIGTSLMQGLIEEAKAADRPITLRVLKPNPVTPFYERLGFDRVGETGTHFLMKLSPRQP